LPKQQAVAKAITPPPVIPVNPYLQSVIDEYDQSILRLMERTGIPGSSIAIVTDSTVVFLKGYGLKRIDSNDSIDEHTVFRIGSVSKCFAAVVTSILVHDKVLNWDDPIVKYLPDFKLRFQDQENLLTIKHLLSHTTGLPYHTYTTLIEDGLDLDTMILRLQDVRNQPAGKEYSYQNVAFSIIAKVIEAATGKTYEEMLREKVLMPLRMTDASVTYEAIFENENIAWPHLTRRRKWRRVPINKTYYNVAPAGGVNASISDMANLMKALLDNRQDVITTESLKEIFTPIISASSKNRSYRKLGRIKNSYYGLGWRIIQYSNDTVIFHGGYVNGYRSEIALYPKDKIGICILSNAPGSVTDTGIPLFLKEYLDKRDSIKFWENSKVPLLARREKLIFIE
jgi:beta-lactamase class C